LETWYALHLFPKFYDLIGVNLILSKNITNFDPPK
jgi:hypothetical protein